MRPAGGAAARLGGTPYRKPQAIRMSELEIAVEERGTKARVRQEFAARPPLQEWKSAVSGAFSSSGGRI